MREGWEYKKLGDIISPAKIIKNKDSIDYPILSITMREGIIFQNDRFKKVIASRDTSTYKVVNNGQLVIAFPIDEGLIYTQDIAEKGIMSPAYDIWDVDYSNVDRKFLVLYLHSNYAMKYYKSKMRGTTQRRRTLPKDDLLKTPLPLPPLSTQKQIVSELDLLSHILDQKRQQLKEYDALAESIFYDIFGDPNKNEKAWVTRDFSSCCENCDSQRKPITAKDRIPGTIPYYGASGIVDYVKDYIFDGSYLLISEDGANLIMRSTPIAFQIKGKNWVNNHAHVVKFKNNEEQIFMEYFFNLLDLKDLITGCAQPKLTQGALNKIPVFDVPLSLQQSFAEKIESIEHQKQLLKESIKETETLFQSRMDYWFNA